MYCAWVELLPVVLSMFGHTPRVPTHISLHSSVLDPHVMGLMLVRGDWL